MKLAWECKRYLPGITTYREREGAVLVSFDGHRVIRSPFLLSHAAAAQWAADEIGRSLNLMFPKATS